jgi:transcriptional repressor NrdR
VKCLYCQGSTRVVDSRNIDDGACVRRRRECEDCEERFTTYERSKLSHVKVEKRDGQTEPFRREKLAAGIRRAFEKRPVDEERLEALIDGIEEEVRSRRQQVVESDTIGDIVCEQLKEVDEVAYLRFASVYKDFSDGTQFVQELENLGPSTHDSNEVTPKHG